MGSVCFHNTVTMCDCFLSINVCLKAVLCIPVCVHISISVFVKKTECVCVCVSICVCVWLKSCLCKEACEQLLWPPLLLARIYSGFGSMKYLRAPKTPALTHTCILRLRNENLPRVLFLKQKSHTPTIEPSL